MKVSSIIPNLPSMQKRISDIRSKEISKIYDDFMNALGYRYYLMSEILEIEETNNVQILFKSFAKQYGDLWIVTGDNRKELMNRLEERIILVLNNNCEEESEVKVNGFEFCGDGI